MWEAPQFDRRHIPLGMCLSQNDIGLPKTRVSMPDTRKYAAAESPYGPAPMTVTSQFIDLVAIVFRYKVEPLIGVVDRAHNKQHMLE